VTFQPEGDERFIGQPVQLTMWRVAAVVKQIMSRHPAGSVLLALTVVYVLRFISRYLQRIIIGSDRQLETKQGIEGKIVRFRLGRVRDRVRVRDN